MGMACYIIIYDLIGQCYYTYMHISNYMLVRETQNSYRFKCHHWYLLFIWQNKAYHWKVLSYELAMVPRVLALIVYLSAWRYLCHILVWYFSLVQSKHASKRKHTFLYTSVFCLGLCINSSKYELHLTHRTDKPLEIQYLTLSFRCSHSSSCHF